VEVLDERPQLDSHPGEAGGTALVLKPFARCAAICA
jgi:hypothetical protein